MWVLIKWLLLRCPCTRVSTKAAGPSIYFGTIRHDSTFGVLTTTASGPLRSLEQLLDVASCAHIAVRAMGSVLSTRSAISRSFSCEAQGLTRELCWSLEKEVLELWSRSCKTRSGLPQELGVATLWAQESQSR